VAGLQLARQKPVLLGRLIYRLQDGAQFVFDGLAPREAAEAWRPKTHA
jgi:hypothetical protein